MLSFFFSLLSITFVVDHWTSIYGHSSYFSSNALHVCLSSFSIYSHFCTLWHLQYSKSMFWISNLYDETNNHHGCFFRYCTFIFLFAGCFDQIDFLPWPWCHCRLIRYLSSLSFEFSLCSILACRQPIPRLRFPTLIWKQWFVGLLPFLLSAQFHFPCLIPFSNSQLTISFLFFCALIPFGQSCLFHFLAGIESRPQSIHKILQTILERFNVPYLKYTRFAQRVFTRLHSSDCDHFVLIVWLF